MTDTESDLQGEAKKRKRGSATKAKKLKKSAKYYDEKGDLEMVSSDDVLFKVHAYVLQAGSVFRAMIADTSSSRIELTDYEIEHGGNLKALFDLLIDGTFDLNKELEELMALARYTLVEDSEYSRQAFAIGVALEDRALCTKALRTDGGEYRELKDREKECFADWLPDGRMEDPASLDLEDFRCFSYETLWAWSRAYRVAFGPYTGDWAGQEEERLEMLSDEFERLMKLKDAPKTLSWEQGGRCEKSN